MVYIKDMRGNPKLWVSPKSDWTESGVGYIFNHNMYNNHWASAVIIIPDFDCVMLFSLVQADYSAIINFTICTPGHYGVGVPKTKKDSSVALCSTKLSKFKMFLFFFFFFFFNQILCWLVYEN